MRAHYSLFNCAELQRDKHQEEQYKVLTRSPACHPTACALMRLAPPYFSTMNTNCPQRNSKRFVHVAASLHKSTTKCTAFLCNGTKSDSLRLLQLRRCWHKRLLHHVHDAQLKAISIDKVSFSSWIMQDEIQTVCQGNFFFPFLYIVVILLDLFPIDLSCRNFWYKAWKIGQFFFAFLFLFLHDHIQRLGISYHREKHRRLECLTGMYNPAPSGNPFDFYTTAV